MKFYDCGARFLQDGGEPFRGRPHLSSSAFTRHVFALDDPARSAFSICLEPATVAPGWSAEYANEIVKSSKTRHAPTGENVSLE
jgi:hypothetical protein